MAHLIRTNGLCKSISCTRHCPQHSHITLWPKYHSCTFLLPPLSPPHPSLAPSLPPPPHLSTSSCKVGRCGSIICPEPDWDTCSLDQPLQAGDLSSLCSCMHGSHAVCRHHVGVTFSMVHQPLEAAEAVCVCVCEGCCCGWCVGSRCTCTQTSLQTKWMFT